MSVFQLPLLAGDTHLGDLISLGGSVVLFTARPELASLDGRTFVSGQHALEAALVTLQAIAHTQIGGAGGLGGVTEAPARAQAWEKAAERLPGRVTPVVSPAGTTARRAN